MPSIRGITICVNYAPLLAITLVRNIRHLTECWVVTSPDDRETQAVVECIPDARLVQTDAFTRHGAAFNKGLAMEEGLDAMGREGWILIHDADTIFPDVIPLENVKPDTLYGARRRIVPDPALWRPDLEWNRFPIALDGGPIGFFQLFHADDPHLTGKRPWYDVSFGHAGGGDAYMLTHWDRGHQIVLPIDCLHLGPKDSHWFGTSEEAKDVMRAFIVRNGWLRSHPGVDPKAAERVGPIKERVQVPGYEPSGFELPFVVRSQQQRGIRT